MGVKYLKPCIRNIKDSIPNADGRCATGSWASGIGISCIPYGGVASGTGCNYGDAPSIAACASGLHPTAYGCQNGDYALVGCASGLSPA